MGTGKEEGMNEGGTLLTGIVYVGSEMVLANEWRIKETSPAIWFSSIYPSRSAPHPLSHLRGGLMVCSPGTRFRLAFRSLDPPPKHEAWSKRGQLPNRLDRRPYSP